jgi:hypothetical protein
MIGFTRIVNGDVLTQQSLRDFPTILLSFPHFFVVFGRYSLFWTTPGKDSGKFPEVRFPKKHTGKLLLECVVEEHLYKAKIP